MQFTYTNRPGTTEIVAWMQPMPTAVKINRLQKSGGMSRVWFDYLAKATHRIVVNGEEIFHGTEAQCRQWAEVAQAGEWRKTEEPITSFITGYPAE